MKKKLLIVLGALALYGAGFICAALDAGDATAKAAHTQAGIRGVVVGEQLA